MGKFSDNLGKAADNAERLAAAMDSIPAAGSRDNSQAPTPTAPTGSQFPTQVVFNTILKGGNGGGGGGGRGRESPSNDPNKGFSEEFIRYLRTLGIFNPENSSKAMIAHLMREFEKMMAKQSATFGIAMRSGGM